MKSEQERVFFDNRDIQEVDAMVNLLDYKPTKIGQKVLIKDCELWYTTQTEKDGKGGERLCWVTCAQIQQQVLLRFCLITSLKV